MPTRLRFDFYGDTQVDRTLANIESRSIDATQAWEAIAERFLTAERRQFDSEGAYGSGGWSPLSPAYAAWKQRHHPGQPILVLTGELRASLTEGPDIRVVLPQDLFVGSSVEYGRYHQRGDGVPQRRPVELPESERDAWVRLLHRFLVTGDAS